MEEMIEYFFSALPFAIIAGAIYAAIRYFIAVKKKEKFSLKKEILNIAFVCYLAGLLSIILVPRTKTDEFSYNLVPTLFLVAKGEYVLGIWTKTMMIANVVMFIPMGIFICLICKKINWKNIWAVALLIPIFIEICQIFIGRSFDIDDIINNFIGTIIGYSIAKLLSYIINRKK